MNRTYLFRLSTLLLFFVYFISIILSLFFGTVLFYKFWFSYFLLILGIIFLIRFFCYKIDASLFLGSFLLFSGICGILNYYFSFKTLTTIGIYLMALSLSSLSIYIVFRQKFHIKTFVFLGLCAILLVVYAEQLLSLIPFIVLLTINGLANLFAIVYSIIYNTRKI